MPFPRALLFAILALTCAFLVGACSEDDDAQGGRLNVQLGVVQSLSGAGSSYGKSAFQGIELAVDEINEAEASVGMTITLVDDGSDGASGKAAFETLAERNVTAIIGPTLSNVALEAMPVAQDASLPALGATTTAQGLTETGEYVFQVALPEAVVVPATLKRVHQDVPIQNAALVFDSTDAFSRSSADAMRAGIQDIGATLTAEIDVSNTDLATQFDALRGQNLNAFLITPLVDKSAEIAKAIRDAGFEQIIIGGNSFNTPGIIEAAGSAVDGAYVGAAWNPDVDTDASKRFVDAYTEKYGDSPDLFAAQGYSSVYLLLDAVKRAGSIERAAVRDALAATEAVTTPLGSITFSPAREAIHQPVVQRFEDGKLVVLP